MSGFYEKMRSTASQIPTKAEFGAKLCAKEDAADVLHYDTLGSAMQSCLQEYRH